MLCNIYLYSTDPTYVQRRKGVLDPAGYTAPTRQHELDHTEQEPICMPCMADLDHGLPDVCVQQFIEQFIRLCVLFALSLIHI